MDNYSLLIFLGLVALGSYIQTVSGFAIALKGGSSTRVHSHMDLGSFILDMMVYAGLLTWERMHKPISVI